MKFSKWIEKKLNENLNPEIDRLRREEKMLLMSIEGRKDPNGMIIGINKAGVVDAMNRLKEVRSKIKELEGSAPAKSDISPVPSWIKNNKAV